MSAEAAKPKEAAAKPTQEAPKGQIRDQGYQPYTGGYTAPSGRWALIYGRMLRMTARQPWVLVMLILSVLPALGWGVGLWVRFKLFSLAMAGGGHDAPVPASLLAAPNDYAYGLAISAHGELLIALLLAMFAGGGAIADDIRGGAFQFYFARPVSREQYLVGKLLPPVTLVFLVVAAPSLLLAVLRVSLATSSDDALHMALVQPAAALGLGLVEALTLGVPVVALSSLSRGRGYVQGAFAAALLLPWIFGSLLVRLTQSSWGAVLSLPAHLQNLGRFFYRLPEPPDERTMPVWASAAILAALIAGSLWLLRRRLAAVEVVAGS